MAFKNKENFFIPKNNYIKWREAKIFFLKLIQSSFNFHLKNKFQKKLLKVFKKCFFELKEYDPEESFYGDDRDAELENGVEIGDDQRAKLGTGNSGRKALRRATD